MLFSEDEKTVFNDYFRSIDDPKSFIDIEKIRELEGRLSQLLKPADKFIVMNEIAELENVDVSIYRKQFIELLRSKKADIAVEALNNMNVSPSILEEAGLKKKMAIPSKRPRGLRASEIVASFRDYEGSFTVADVIEKSGSSQATVRKAISEAIEIGLVKENLELQLSSMEMPGRPAKRYVYVHRD